MADHDTTPTVFDEPISLLPIKIANDIAYGGEKVVKSSLDLDPATKPVSRRPKSVTGGTFVASRDGTVTFTPNAGFVGRAEATYVVKGHEAPVSSNEARLTVQVLPELTAAINPFDFGVRHPGLGAVRGAGTISQAAAFRGNGGTSSLEISVTGEGTFGGSSGFDRRPDGQAGHQDRPTDAGRS